MGYRVEITKCYLVQIVDDEGNARDYTYAHTEERAEQKGKEMLEAIKRRDEMLCKCGYDDCICNTERYKNICAICVNGSEYDDEDK